MHSILPSFTTRRLFAIFFTLALFACSASAHARAYFAGRDEMIARSTLIVVAEITRVEKSETQGTHWLYHQRATATVHTVVKGTPPEGKSITLYGEENFICAQCHYAPGRYILFLREDPAPDGSPLLTGSNWHLSIRPITKDESGVDQVEWFTDSKDRTLAQMPLQDVPAEIQRVIDAKPASEQRPESAKPH